MPASGKLARIAVLFSNTVDLALIKISLSPGQSVLKTFPMHDGAFYALVHEEIRDQGAYQWFLDSSEKITPTNAPVDRSWRGKQYVIDIDLDPIAPSRAALMLLLHNLPEETSGFF